MTLYTFLHTPDLVADDAAAAATHVLTMSNAIRSQGGAISPSAIQYAICYDSSTAVGTGVTDSAGNTYTLKTVDSNVANGFTLEVWECHDAVGGVTPIITWQGSAAVKCVHGAVEVDQIAPVNPTDGSSTVVQQATHRVDVTNSTSRTSASTVATKNVAEYGVFIGFLGWNDTRTISAAGVGYTGLAQIKGGATNLGLGFIRRSAEIKNIAGSQTISRFTMSASGTQPAAVSCVCYFRDSVSADNDKDGYTDNIEMVTTVYTGTSPNFVYRSSTSSPGGGTGGSEYSQAFTWQRKLYVKTGVTIADDYNRYFYISDGYDDGSGLLGYYWSSFNNNQIGQSLDAADEFVNPSHYANPITIDANVFTEYSYAPKISVDVDPNQPTTAFKVTEDGDSAGLIMSNYINIVGYAGNIPQFAIFALTYPVIVTDVPQMNMTGVGT